MAEKFQLARACTAELSVTFYIDFHIANTTQTCCSCTELRAREGGRCITQHTTDNHRIDSPGLTDTLLPKVPTAAEQGYTVEPGAAAEDGSLGASRIGQRRSHLQRDGPWGSDGTVQCRTIAL